MERTLNPCLNPRARWWGEWVAVGNAKKCFAAEKGSWRKVPAREERVV